MFSTPLLYYSVSIIPGLRTLRMSLVWYKGPQEYLGTAVMYMVVLTITRVFVARPEGDSMCFATSMPDQKTACACSTATHTALEPERSCQHGQRRKTAYPSHAKLAMIVRFRCCQYLVTIPTIRIAHVIRILQQIPLYGTANTS